MGVRLAVVLSHGREGGESAPSGRERGESPVGAVAASSVAQEQSQRSSEPPGLTSMTTISVLESTYQSEPTWRLWSGPTSASLHFFFFFFFFVGQGGSSAAKTKKSQRGEMVSQPQQLTVPWSGAPSSSTACSLELSLPSPAGIWFKTPLPVGGANTVNDLAARRPKPRRLQRPGVWGSPMTGAAMEYPLNLQGASCPTLAMMTPVCD